MIDFHTHILPNMDDGSNSVETSLELLSILEKENVKLVCLTSHFYAEYESIDDYIKRRQESFNKLNYNGNLELRLGAEIKYYRGISISEDIGKLVLEGTKILLIEFPLFVYITKSMIEEVILLRNKGYRVVIAHIERYLIKNSDIDYLHDNGILFQMNSECINNAFTRNRALKLIFKYYISYLGSDCHNLENRLPNYNKAIEILNKKINYVDISMYINNLYCLY